MVCEITDSGLIDINEIHLGDFLFERYFPITEISCLNGPNFTIRCRDQLRNNWREQNVKTSDVRHYLQPLTSDPP